MLDGVLQDVRDHLESERKAKINLRDLTEKSTDFEVCFGMAFLYQPAYLSLGIPLETPK